MPRSNFQIILLLAFGFFAVIAIFIFSGTIPLFKSNEGISGNVLIWGTLPQSAMDPVLGEIAEENSDVKIEYVEKTPSNFDKEFIEALASGSGPDLFLLSQDYILRYSNKIFAIPYTSLSEREFKDTYVQEGELYLTGDGILALPLSLDPMVMYWNRDIFSSEGVATPPSYWDELPALAAKLTKKDAAGNITRSAVALGDYKNVNYAKDIIATLFLQLGNSIVARDAEGKPRETLAESEAGARLGESVLRFYTEFADPAKPTYSWNRSISSSKQAFIAGRAGLYFGYASEILELREKNPHLNFDVARIPQVRDAKAKANFGRLQGMAITKASQNPRAAFYVAGLLSSSEFAGMLSENLYLPPARRDLLSVKPSDPYLSIFYDNALTARAWLDPSPFETDAVFGETINNILSGRFRPSEALGAMRDELRTLLQ